MKTLYIERSTGACRDGHWVNELDLAGVSRIVVGTGPGSFAGIRSALAFAQGYALGSGCEVLGLPSPCAVAAQVFASRATEMGRAQALSVVGDARRGKFWIAIFAGYALTREVFQVEQADLSKAVPEDARVVTPDVTRIDGILRETFGVRYLGGETPTAEGLQAFAEACPGVLTREPLPLYLNPAVRD